MSYLGFALPYLLTLGYLRAGWSPVEGLCVVLALGMASLLWLLWLSVRDGAGHPRLERANP